MCVGVPARIVEVEDPELGQAIADVRGKRQRVNVALLADDGGLPEPDGWVLLHMGFAMEHLSAEEAADLERFQSDLASGLFDMSPQPPDQQEPGSPPAQA